MKYSSRQFGDKFSGFGRQSKKFSRIGACIRRNFTPGMSFLTLKIINAKNLRMGFLKKTSKMWHINSQRF